MASRSYVNDHSFSSADTDLWNQWQEQRSEGRVDIPPAEQYPHAYRWYVHINALMRLKNAEDATFVNFLTNCTGASSSTSAANDRKCRYSDVSLTHLKKEACARAVRRETTPVLFTIQITPRNAESRDSRMLWEKIIQTALPEETVIKWGEFFTWMPAGNGPKKILQTTFVSRIATDNSVSSWNGDTIVSSILHRHPEDVEFCKIVSQTAL